MDDTDRGDDVDQHDDDGVEQHDDDGEDGFQVHTNTRKQKLDPYKPYWKYRGKKFVYMSEVFTQYYADKWNMYFKTITGKDMDFKFSPRTIPYASALECRRNLDVLTIPLMSERPTIWDLTLGSGSDLVAFALFSNFRKYFGVDIMAKRDFDVTIENARNFIKLYPDDYPPGCLKFAGDGRDTWNDENLKIYLRNGRAKEFIHQYRSYVQTELPWHFVHYVYVDPSWSGDFLTKASDEDRCIGYRNPNWQSV